MQTLFERMMAPYPSAPGFKDRDTSREAAEAIRPDAARLRAMCLRKLKDVGTATADEVAALLDLSVLSVRPRFTELLHAGEIRDTGERRKNGSGRSAKVWCTR
jgi:predicted ArsR family transcriptional regulator